MKQIIDKTHTDKSSQIKNWHYYRTMEKFRNWNN